MPVFIDRHGHACSVAHLMIRSGRQASAEKIARSNNHVYVADVSEGPLVEWILQSGLTQEECAQIQPAYEFEWDRDAQYRSSRSPREAPVVEGSEEERQRIRDHLAKGEKQFRDRTHESLALAVRRSLGRVRQSGMDFLVHRAARKETTLRNHAGFAVSVRVTRLKSDGRIESRDEWRELGAGQTFATPGDRLLVEGYVSSDTQMKLDYGMSRSAPWAGIVRGEDHSPSIRSSPFMTSRAASTSSSGTSTSAVARSRGSIVLTSSSGSAAGIPAASSAARRASACWTLPR